MRVWNHVPINTYNGINQSLAIWFYYLHVKIQWNSWLIMLRISFLELLPTFGAVCHYDSTLWSDLNRFTQQQFQGLSLLLWNPKAEPLMVQWQECIYHWLFVRMQGIGRACFFRNLWANLPQHLTLPNSSRLPFAWSSTRICRTQLKVLNLCWTIRPS